MQTSGSHLDATEMDGIELKLLTICAFHTLGFVEQHDVGCQSVARPLAGTMDLDQMLYGFVGSQLIIANSSTSFVAGPGKRNAVQAQKEDQPGPNVSEHQGIPAAHL